MNGEYFFWVRQFKAPTERKIIAQGNPVVAGAALGESSHKIILPLLVPPCGKEKSEL
jgi:hypothetical protein